MFREHLGINPQIDVAVVFCASVVELHQAILFFQEAMHLLERANVQSHFS